MKCGTCRKDDAILTWWERVRFWFFQRFHQDILDLAQEKYTMGFGDGFKRGVETKVNEGQMVLDEVYKLESKLDQALRPLIYPSKFQGVDQTKVLDVILPGGRMVLTLNEKPLTEREMEQLKAEADYFTRSNLWSIMQETVKQKAVIQGMERSKTWEETLSSKMMIHNLGILQDIVGKILSTKKQ